MKLNINIFLGLLLITLITCEGANRLKTKTKRFRSKEDTCKQNYNIYIDGNECQYSVVDDFSRSNLANKEGLFFKTTDRKGALEKIASIKNGKMFLPYRNMGPVNFSENCWVLCARTYYFTMTADDKKVYNVIIYLDRNCFYTHENIEDVQKIDQNRLDTLEAITSARRDTIENANQYIVNSSDAVVQSQGKDAINAQISAHQKDVNDMVTKIDTLSTTINSLDAKEKKEKTALEQKQSELEAVTNLLNQQHTSLREKEVVVKELQAKIENSHNEATILAERAGKAKLAFETTITAFEKDSPGVYSTPIIQGSLMLLGQCPALSNKLNSIIS